MLKFIFWIKKIFQGGNKVCSQAQGKLTCLEYRDGEYCIAHCLEFDIVAQGKTFEEARQSLASLIKEQFDFSFEKDIEEKTLFHPAPSKYWTILESLKTRIARRNLLSEGQVTAEGILNRLECFHAVQ